MALIKCSECGGQLSDRATACPRCGCPVSSDPVKPSIIPSDGNAVCQDAKDQMREQLWREPLSKLAPPSSLRMKVVARLPRNLLHPILSLRSSIGGSSGHDLVSTALKIYTNLLDNNLRFKKLPQSAPSLVSAHHGSDDYAERGVWLDAAMTRDPMNPIVYYEQARCLAKSGYPCNDFKDHPHAIAAFAKLDRAIQLSPDYAEALLLRGVVYKNLAQNEKALRDLHKAVQLVQGGGFETRAKEVCLLARVRLYGVLNQADKEIEDYSALIQLSLYQATTEYCLSQYLAYRSRLYNAMGEHDKAISDTTQAIQVLTNSRPENRVQWLVNLASAWEQRGDASSTKGDFDEATASYGHALEFWKEARNDTLTSMLLEKLADLRNSNANHNS